MIDEFAIVGSEKGLAIIASNGKFYSFDDCKIIDVIQTGHLNDIHIEINLWASEKVKGDMEQKRYSELKDTIDTLLSKKDNLKPIRRIDV